MKIRKRVIFLFLAPACLLYLFFFLVPLVWSFYYSVFDWSGFSIANKTYIGFNNYLQLMKDPVFWMSFGNSMKILLIGGVITFFLSFLLSVLINSGIRGRKFFRAMVFLPNVIATIALTTLWAFLYNPKFGLLNGFFNLVGLKGLGSTLWTSTNNIFFAMLMALIWIEVGFYLVLFMAGMDKIPLEYMEAAKIEGASLWQSFVKITLPLMWDVISVATVLWAIFALRIFEFPYAFSGITPPKQIYTVGIYLFIMGFGKRDPIYRLGYATAIGVLLLLAVILVTTLLNRLMKREVYEY